MVINTNEQDFVIKNKKLQKYMGNGGDVVIPDGVRSIGAAVFFEHTTLTSITIPKSVTSIGDCAFLSCTSLASINIPDSVTEIGERTFKGCGKLVITTPAGSYAEEYAKKKRIKVNLI